jgi:hypothetical protein
MKSDVFYFIYKEPMMKQQIKHVIIFIGSRDKGLDF